MAAIVLSPQRIGRDSLENSLKSNGLGELTKVVPVEGRFAMQSGLMMHTRANL